MSWDGAATNGLGFLINEVGGNQAESPVIVLPEGTPATARHRRYDCFKRSLVVEHPDAASRFERIEKNLMVRQRHRLHAR